jgi:lipopolysaccharide export LptBFGC system permease protein LptF
VRLARPSILWRFILRELWRLLAVTLSVLMSVLAFGVTIKPLAEGRIDLLDAVRYMGYAGVAMLQYAAPFAACFAATLVYHRMARDNEVHGAYAGGISHRAMLAPAVLTAGLLAGGVVLLADQVIPRLLRGMSELLADDATRLIEHSIARGQSVRFQNRSLWADAFAGVPAGSLTAQDEAAGVFRRFRLAGLVATERSAEGTVSTASARSADVWLVREPGTSADEAGATRVVMRLNDFVLDGRGTGAVGDGSTLVFRVPTRLTDDPKYLSLAGMRQAQRTPEMLNSINRSRLSAARLLGERLIADELRRTLQRGGVVRFTNPEGRAVVLRAGGIAPTPGVEGFALLPGPGGSVGVEVELAPDRTRRHTARRATLALVASPEVDLGVSVGGAGESFLRLRLEDVVTSLAGRGTGGGPGATPMDADTDPDASDGAGGRLREYTLSGLRPADDPSRRTVQMGSFDLLAAMRARLESPAGAGDETLREGTARFDELLQDHRREIISKQHERLATGLACFATVMLGAVMGMRLRDRLPLVVYLWAFLPALGAVLTISGGQRLTHATGLPGLLLLYGGVAALVVLIFAEYSRLARH